MPGARVAAASQRLKKGGFFPVERPLVALLWGLRLSGHPSAVFPELPGPLSQLATATPSFWEDRNVVCYFIIRGFRSEVRTEWRLGPFLKGPHFSTSSLTLVIGYFSF